MSALLWTPPMQTNLVISGHLLSSHSKTYSQLLLISKTAEKRRFLRLCLEKQHGAAPCKSCFISWRTPDPTTYQGICVGCFGSAAKSLTGKPLAHPNNLSFWILGPRLWRILVKAEDKLLKLSSGEWDWEKSDESISSNCSLSSAKVSFSWPIYVFLLRTALTWHGQNEECALFPGEQLSLLCTEGERGKKAE